MGAAGPANPCPAPLSPPAQRQALLHHVPTLAPRSSCHLSSPLSWALEGHGLPRENRSTEETHPGLETGYRWWLRRGIPGSLKPEAGLKSRLQSKCARLYAKWAQLHGSSGSWSCQGARLNKGQRLSSCPGGTAASPAVISRVFKPSICRILFAPSEILEVILLVSRPQFTWKVKVKGSQSCPTLCNPMDCTVHRILQSRILEWVAFPFSRGSSWPRDQIQVSRTAGRLFTSWATREARLQGVSWLVRDSIHSCRVKGFLVNWIWRIWKYSHLPDQWQFTYLPEALVASSGRWRWNKVYSGLIRSFLTSYGWGLWFLWAEPPFSGMSVLSAAIVCFRLFWLNAETIWGYLSSPWNLSLWLEKGAADEISMRYCLNMKMFVSFLWIW